MTNSVPSEYSPVAPHLIVKDAKEAVDFYRRAFGADELQSSPGPDGRIWICEIMLNGTRLLLHEEFPDMGLHAPISLGGVSVQLHVYVPDADAAYARAIQEGATPVQEPLDSFWGDRYSQVQDPSGHRWVLATQIEDLPLEELRERQQEYNARHTGISQPTEVSDKAAFKEE
jgi:PhnB protein